MCVDNAFNNLFSSLKTAKGSEEDLFKSCISELKLKKDLNICWYPSSGGDFRDLIYTNPDIADLINMETIPDIYIHTDFEGEWYFSHIFEHDRFEVNRHGKFEMIINHKIQLDFEGINFFISEKHAAFPESANPSPKGYFLDLTVYSDILKPFKVILIYLFFENVNFFEEYVIKRKIPISHIYKNRDGTGFGGNKTRVSFIYKMLGWMKTKYLVTDDCRYENENDKDYLKNISQCGETEIRKIISNSKMCNEISKALDSDENIKTYLERLDSESILKTNAQKRRLTSYQIELLRRYSVMNNMSRCFHKGVYKVHGQI